MDQKDKITLGIVGSSGKLGKLVVDEASRDSIFFVQTLLNRPSQEEFLFRSCQVVIDVSHHETTQWLVDTVNMYTDPPALVIGTTGLPSKLQIDIQNYAKKAPVVLDVNFSVGATALKILSQNVYKLLGKEWDVSIIDIHHKYKRDSPSGTALAIQKYLSDYEGEISTFSLRFGEMVGKHTVNFQKKDGSESFSLEHQVSNRNCFSTGALQAAKWVANNRPPSIYSMRDVLRVI